MACKRCGACCGYVALEIRDESVPWLALHGLPTFVENGVHKLIINSPCEWYTGEGCSNYEERPPICRDYLCEKAST